MRSLGCFLFFRLVWLQSCNFSAKSVETIFFISAFRFPFPFAACDIFTACWFQLCKQTQSISIFAIYLRCRQVKDVRRHSTGLRSRILPCSLCLSIPHPHTLKLYLLPSLAKALEWITMSFAILPFDGGSHAYTDKCTHKSNLNAQNKQKEVGAQDTRAPEQRF